MCYPTWLGDSIHSLCYPCIDVQLYWVSMSNTCWARCMVLPPWILDFRLDLGFLRLVCKNALNILDEFLNFFKSLLGRGLAWISFGSPSPYFQDELSTSYVNTTGWVTEGCLNEFSRRTHFSIVWNEFLISNMFVSSMYLLYPCSSDKAPNYVSPRATLDKCLQILCIYPGVRTK